MQIQSLLSDHNISLNTTGIDNKDSLLRKASELLSNQETSAENIYGALLSREKTATTAMGNGIAIPHGRVAQLTTPSACLIRLANGVDFGANDQQVTDLFIALAIPADCTEEHLKLLASVAEILSDDETVKALRDATSADSVIELIN